MSIKSKFFRGWLDYKNMVSPEWLHTWMIEARKAEVENFEIYLFRIPKTKNGFPDVKTVTEIERFLQNKFPDEST